MNLPRQRLGTDASAHMPAPIGGWNTRDSIVGLKEIYATFLDNWFPRVGEVVQRGGSSSFSTGMTGTVKSLVQYQPGSGSGKLYGVTDAGLYDITAGGAAGAVAKALTNGYISAVNFANSAGTNFLWVCNGTDTPTYWNGAAWANATITGTGLTPSNLVWAWLFKHRIFAIEKGTMNVWFLPLDSIQGAAQSLPFGNLFARGGYLVSGCGWTLDSGTGPDDLFVIVTSEGEIAVYEGTDPTSASSWGIVGVYYVGKPLGRRCFVKLAGDVGILTENGLFPLSKVLQSGSLNFSTALTRLIQPTYTSTTADVGITTVGWEGVVYPQFDAFIMNVPAGSLNPNIHQFAMNTVTGALSSFSGWNANCFIVFNDQLYFGKSGGVVMKAWDAEGALVSDSNADIVTTAYCASSFFGQPDRLKQINLFRLLLAYNASVQVRWGIAPDYSDSPMPSLTTKGSSTSSSKWDISPWDTTPWAVATARYKIWRAASHIPGYALALRLQTANNGGSLSWAGTDYLIGPGGLM